MSVATRSSKQPKKLASKKGQSKSALEYQQLGKEFNRTDGAKRRLESAIIRLRIEEIKHEWNCEEKKRRRLIGEAKRAQLLNLVSRYAA